MDRIKQLGGKFLILMLSFMMICSIVQIPVKAAGADIDVMFDADTVIEVEAGKSTTIKITFDKTYDNIHNLYNHWNTTGFNQDNVNYCIFTVTPGSNAIDTYDFEIMLEDTGQPPLTVIQKLKIKTGNHDITVTTDGNGTASADVSKAKNGDTVTLTATPNTGYKFKKWQSAEVFVQNNNQFVMPNKAVTVKAIFEAEPVERTATVENVEIKGVVGEAMSKNITVTLTNDELNFSTMDTSQQPTSNLPNGIELDYATSSDKKYTFTLYVSGTPTASGKGAIELTIPGTWLKSGEDLKVTSNPNAKFDITGPSATIENVEIKGVVGEAVDKDITVTLTNDELNIGNMDISKKPTSNLPAGISLGYGSSSSNQKFKISVFGTPTATGNGTLELTIPGAWLKSGKDLKVTANSNAKYDFANIKVTAGAGSTHKTGGNENMTFTCNGSLANLTGIYVDGTLLDPSNYTVKSGSTILTLKASYLNTLTTGTHTLKFQYKNDMSADTSFDIVKDDYKSGTPETGDTTTMMLSFSMLIVSGGILAILLKKRKAETN